MPYHRISDNLRQLVIKKHNDGLGYRKISREINMPITTVARICQGLERSGVRKKGHRKAKLAPPQQQELVKVVQENNSLTLKVRFFTPAQIKF